VAAVLVWALGALAYANSVPNEFAYDDMHIIVENPGIQSLDSLPAALAHPYWTGGFGRELGLWRPTTTLVLGLEYAVAGEYHTFYHLVNVLVHAGVSVLVVLLLFELLSLPAAFAGGLIFAVHPVHVEAVANVIGVAELLSAGFFLAACLVHVRSGPESRWRSSLAVGLLYMLAFGAKESAVTLPGIIFLLDGARERLSHRDLAGYLRRRWKVYGVMAVVAAFMLLVRVRILGSVASPFGPLGADLLEEVPKIWTLAEVWSHYVRLMIFPMDLSMDYSPNVIPISMGWGAANSVGAVLALAILAGALFAWRRPEMARGRDTARAASFAVVWFVITISPIANVFFLSGVLLAERTLYLPSVGIVAAMGWAVVRWARIRPRGAWVGLGVVVLLMGAKTYDRNPTWKDNLTAFGQLLEDYPHSGRSQWVLGDLFFQQGREREGLVSYRAAIDILGPHYQLITEISRKLMSRERYDAAEHLLNFAWKDNPGIQVAPGILATIASEKGDALATETYCLAVIEIKETDPGCHHLLAWAYADQGRWEEAARSRTRAIELGEGDYWQQWMSLFYLELHAGDTTAALVALDSARAKTVLSSALDQVNALYVELGFQMDTVESGGATR